MDEPRQQDPVFSPLAERVAVLEDHDEHTASRLHEGDLHFAELDRQIRRLSATQKALVDVTIPERVRSGLDDVMETVTHALKETVEAKRAAQAAQIQAAEAATHAERVKLAVATADRAEALVKAIRIPDCSTCPQASRQEGESKAQAVERQRQEARDRRLGLMINLGAFVAMLLAYVVGASLFFGKLAAIKGGVP